MLIDMDSAHRRSSNPTFAAISVRTSILDHCTPEFEDADDELRRDAILAKYEWT